MENLKSAAHVYNDLMSSFLYTVKILQKGGEGFISYSSSLDSLA